MRLIQGLSFSREKEPILPDDNVGTLYERLMHKGAKLVLKTVEAVTRGDYSTTPQKELAEPKHAPKIFKETCEINWEQPTSNVHNFVRGLSPYPAAWTTLAGKNLKVYTTKVSIADEMYSPGTFYSDNKNYLKVNTLDGALEILELQLEGKKKMNVKDFLLGNKIEA